MQNCQQQCFLSRCLSQLAKCTDELFAGVIFWQWGFAPYIAEEFLQGCIHCQAIQVSSSDGVFKNIVAPAAEYAAQMAVSRSPVPGCKPGMGNLEPFLLCCAVTC